MTKSKKVKKKLYYVQNCQECPHCTTERTMGAGYAVDYICEATHKTIVGYVEWDSEAPKDGVFPEWCPLKDTK